jgi:hypothetical protein
VFKSISLNFIAKFAVRIKPFVYKSVYSSYQLNHPKPPPIVGQALKGLKSGIQEDSHLIKDIENKSL